MRRFLGSVAVPVVLAAAVVTGVARPAGAVTGWQFSGPTGGSSSRSPSRRPTRTSCTPWSTTTRGTPGSASRRTAVSRGPTRAAGSRSRSTSSLTVDPTDPDRAWVGATNAVERTTNGGTLWTSPNTDLDGQFVEDVAGDPSDPDTLYAATQNNGVYRSTNGGDTWKHKSSGIPSVDRDIRALLIDPDHTSKVYAGALAGGLFASTDSGATWTARNSGIDQLEVLALDLDPTNEAKLFAGTPGGFYRSTNHGNAWSAKNTGLERNHTNALAVNPGNSDIVYQGAEGGGLIKTSDGGDSWTLRSDLDWFAASLVRAVAVDPVDHSTVFAGGVIGDHAMARSTDGGLHWSFMSSAGLFNPGDIEVSAVDHDYVWASGPNDAVWKSSNGGDTWHKKSSGLTDTFVTEIALSPSSTDIAYAACGISGGVFKTTDGGASWTQKNNGLTNHAVNAIVVDPDDKKHVLLGTISSGVFESTDGGSSWTPKNVGLPSNADVTALAFNPTDTQNVFVGLAGTGVYVSSNGSDTWSDLNTGLPTGASRFIQDIAMSADGLVLYAGTSTGVYRLDA